MSKNQKRNLDNTETDSEILVTDEFIKENQTLCKTIQHNERGGRHSKKDRLFRQKEVFRLHFEQGKSARKIAKQMRINRKTIDSDVDHWYSELIKKWKITDIKNHIVKQIQMMDMQRERLLDDRENNPDQIFYFEKLIFEINDKIANLLIKIDTKDVAVKEEANRLVCVWAEKQGLDFRAIDPWRLANIPAAKYQQIMSILDSEVR